MKTLTPNPFASLLKGVQSIIQSAVNNQIIYINLMKTGGVILWMFLHFFFLYLAAPPHGAERALWVNSVIKTH